MNEAAISVSTPRSDQRVLGPGTMLRFALLLFLLLASSASMIWEMMSALPSIPGVYHARDPAIGCVLAAGVDPEGGLVASHWPAVLNSMAFRACTARNGGAWNPPWWAAFVATGILIAAAIVLYWGLPAWRGRRRRVAGVEEIDSAGELRSLLSELANCAGLTREPRFVVDPAAATTSAVVFGRPRLYTVCLHGGLVSRRAADASGFRAVILHELAHIRNRDVDITYATVALWRVYLIAVLVPYAASGAWEFLSTQVLGRGVHSIWWPATRSLDTREFALSAFMVLLVYLARTDILRSREIYADLDAVSWGADPAGWHHDITGRRRPAKIMSALIAFAEVWRTHPAWDLRKYSLTDPSVLFGVPSLQMFLTGAAATIISGELSSGVVPGGTWPTVAEMWFVAGFAAAVSTVALWRAVTHAVLTDRRLPSGLRAGLWLGAGLAVGELLLSGMTGANLLPSRPAFLLPLVLIAVVTAWWTIEYAELSVRTSRGRGIRPAMLAGLAATWLLLAISLDWWQSVGAVFAGGWPLAPRGVVQYVTQGFHPVIPGHSGVLSAIAVAFTIQPPENQLPGASGLASDLAPLLLPLLALWLLPLLAWARRPPTSVRLPPLRRVLLAGVLGGISCWPAAAAVMAYMHSWHIPLSQRSGTYFLIYAAWLVVAVAAGTIVTAALAAAVTRRYQLISALSIAGIAALIGLAGAFLLKATDGCAGPLTTFASSCGWRPSGAWPIIWLSSSYVLSAGLLAAAVAAVLGAAASGLVRTITRNRAQPARPPQPQPDHPNGVLARRVAVALICAAAVGFAVAVASAPPGHASASAGISTAQLGPGSVAPPSRAVRKLQLAAWFIYGGNQLLSRFTADMGAFGTDIGDLATAMKKAPSPSTFHHAAAPIGPVCASLGRMAQQAAAYFPVPDPRIQRTWSNMLGQVRKGSADCRSFLQQQSPTVPVASLRELARAEDAGTVLLEQLHAAIKGYCLACA